MNPRRQCRQIRRTGLAPFATMAKWQVDKRAFSRSGFSDRRKHLPLSMSERRTAKRLSYALGGCTRALTTSMRNVLLAMPGEVLGESPLREISLAGSEHEPTKQSCTRKRLLKRQTLAVAALAQQLARSIKRLGFGAKRKATSGQRSSKKRRSAGSRGGRSTAVSKGVGRTGKTWQDVLNEERSMRLQCARLASLSVGRTTASSTGRSARRMRRSWPQSPRAVHSSDACEVRAVHRQEGARAFQGISRRRAACSGSPLLSAGVLAISNERVAAKSEEQRAGLRSRRKARR